MCLEIFFCLKFFLTSYFYFKSQLILFIYLFFLHIFYGNKQQNVENKQKQTEIYLFSLK